MSEFTAGLIMGLIYGAGFMLLAIVAFRRDGVDAEEQLRHALGFKRKKGSTSL